MDLQLSASNYISLKTAGLNPTQSGLFPNPRLGHYRTEHMLGYLNPVALVGSYDPAIGLLI